MLDLRHTRCQHTRDPTYRDTAVQHLNVHRFTLLATLFHDLGGILHFVHHARRKSVDGLLCEKWIDNAPMNFMFLGVADGNERVGYTNIVVKIWCLVIICLRMEHPKVGSVCRSVTICTLSHLQRHTLSRTPDHRCAEFRVRYGGSALKSDLAPRMKTRRVVL